MLQRAISCLIMAVLIALSSVGAVYAEPRGPKIFGFQVGMPWDDALKVAEAYAEKHNLEIKLKKVGKIIHYVSVKEGETNYIVLTPTDHYSGGLLNSITFYPDAFNFKNASPDVYRKIFDHYGLKFDELKELPSRNFAEKNRVGYSDINQGFQVAIYTGGTTWLSINMIEKQSELNLE